MYTLYFLPGVCSLATQVILRELNQPFELVHRDSVEDYERINHTRAVPVLVDEGRVLTEGAALILYLLEKHPNNLLPSDQPARQQVIQDILFANATMHPAYGRLFFINQHLHEEPARQTAMDAAANAINHLWQGVEKRLRHQPYLGGEKISPADILLTVYSRWGDLFPVDIVFGDKVSAMLANTMQAPNFQAALKAEAEHAG